MRKLGDNSLYNGDKTVQTSLDSSLNQVNQWAKANMLSFLFTGYNFFILATYLITWTRTIILFIILNYHIF